jgi:ABC-type Fe3+/spermidine/putrescine transport system ATPase subunit
MTTSGPLPANLVIDNVSKRFGDVNALSGCSIEARPGEILALLGPSGCGKTTLLNLIAGFVTPDSGAIFLNGADITTMPQSRRRTAMVFQSYALFPHLSVGRNISYGLDAQKVPRADSAARVKGLAELFGIGGLLDRLPAELSGGQRQRVAIARAVAVRPQVLLLDEALSALDKILRERMQIELALLLRRLSVTVIMVTHDQREAFAMADRVAVMNGGRIEQVGTAEEIYTRPRSRFVLGFIGGANLVKGTVTGAPGERRFEADCGLRVASPGEDARLRYVRVEDLRFSLAPTPVHNGRPAVIAHVSFLGAVVRVVAMLGDVELVADIPAPEFTPGLTPGAPVYAGFDTAKLRPLADD